jgi:predicted acyltransferase
MEKERLVSLDAFRGASVAAMILVNNPGDWEHVYWPLDHAPWHGWTPTDLIFPFFLFIVGMALPFSHRKHFGEALRRTLVIAGLGLFMSAYPHFALSTVRIPGVLMRIAVCYLAAWCVHRVTGPMGQAVAAAALLVFYWYAMTQVPVPDGSAPNLEPGTNLAAWWDRNLLAGHLWKQSKTWDPEGPLSTLPAIATTLFGVLAGGWLRSDRDDERQTAGFLAAGLAFVLLGLAWSASFPLNKNLWTSSYAVFTAGMAAYFFGLLYWIADVRGYREWTRPLVVYGRNAIFVFVASGLAARTLGVIKVRGPEGPVSLLAWLPRTLFASWLPPHPASLAWAVANVVFWYAVLREMDRRGIYLKV